MPLPNIKNGCALQCKAKAKHTGLQCLNLAAYRGLVCRFHGARKPETILKGQNHPNYKHGLETKGSKIRRSVGRVRMRKLEDLASNWFFRGFKKSKGRKPNGY